MHSIYAQHTAQARQFEQGANARAETVASGPNSGAVGTVDGTRAKGTKAVIAEDLECINNVAESNTLYHQVTGHVCARRKGMSGEIASMVRIRQDIADARAAGAADEVEEEAQ